MTSTSLREEVANGTRMTVDRMNYSWHPFATTVLTPPFAVSASISGGAAGFPSAVGTWTQLWPPVAMSRDYAAADDDAWPVDEGDDGEGGCVGALLRASIS